MNNTNDIKITIQTFDDSKQGRPLERIFVYNQEQCKDLNSKGAGIFWCINPQENTNTRSIGNTAFFNCLGLDCDIAKDKQALSNEKLTELKNELLTTLKTLAVPPTGIIETKNGLQPFWVWTKPKELQKENRTQNNEEYKQLVKGFTKVTGISSEGDSICRVLRLPNYYHQKSNKFLIKKIYTGEKVDFNEFIKAYPPIIDTPQPTNNVVHDGTLESIPVQEVLEKLSGLDIVNNEIYTFKHNSNGTIQIIIDGHSTKHYITTNNRIGGNSSGEIGTPTVINWLAWYLEKGGDNRRMAHAKAYNFLQTLYPKTVKLQPKIEVEEVPVENTEIDLPTLDADRMTQTIMNNGNKGIETGYKDFDSVTGGLKPQFTYLIAARSKNCKSMLALNMLVNIAKQKIPVAYFDLENGELLGTNRLVQIYAGLDREQLKTLKEKNPEVIQETLKEIEKELTLFPVYNLGEYSGLMHKRVLSMIKAYVAKHGVRVVVIDNMNVFTTTTNDNNSFFSSIYSEIDALANELNISIIVIHHITDKGNFDNLSTNDFNNNIKQPVSVPHISKILGTSAAISKMKVGATMALNHTTNELYFWLQTNRDGEQDKRFKLIFDEKTLRVLNPATCIEQSQSILIALQRVPKPPEEQIIAHFRKVGILNEKNNDIKW